MKKLFQIVAAFIVTIGIFAGLGVTKSEADFIIWGSWETGKGQIGNLTFLKDVKLYKRNVDGSLSIEIGKKGKIYPVYAINLPSQYNPITTYNIGGGIKPIPQSNLIKYENIQMSYIVEDGAWSIYAKVYGKPYEYVYVNYFKNGKWVKTDKLQLDKYGFLRTSSFDVKSPGVASWQIRVYYFSNKRSIWTKKINIEEKPSVDPNYDQNYDPSNDW